MNSTLSRILLCLTLLGASAGAMAEQADRDKPMNIEADALRYDDVKQVSVFSGNVVLTKGTIVIRGQHLEVRQDPDGYQYGVVTGGEGLAYFRQKREGVDESIEGQAKTIEYDGRADSVRLLQSAVLRRYRGSRVGDEITGARISYDNQTDLFTVDGRASAAAPGAPGGRVRAMLTPKPADASAPASGAALPLRPSRTLGGAAP